MTQEVTTEQPVTPEPVANPPSEKSPVTKPAIDDKELRNTIRAEESTRLKEEYRQKLDIKEREISDLKEKLRSVSEKDKLIAQSLESVIKSYEAEANELRESISKIREDLRKEFMEMKEKEKQKAISAAVETCKAKYGDNIIFEMIPSSFDSVDAVFSAYEKASEVYKKYATLKPEIKDTALSSPSMPTAAAAQVLPEQSSKVSGLNDLRTKVRSASVNDWAKLRQDALKALQELIPPESLRR